MYWCEGNGTKSAKLKKRLDTAFKDEVEHVWVDEFGTSKYDCTTTHEELLHAYRRGIGRGGQAGWVRDRDVKFRKTESNSLESRHPCSYPTVLLENKGFRQSDLARYTVVDRDFTSAYAIEDLAGIPDDERPQCYRRKKAQEDTSVSNQCTRTMASRNPRGVMSHSQ